MKTILKLTLSFIVAMVLLPTAVLAQDVDYSDPRYAKFGVDNATRDVNLRNYSFFKEAFKMGSYSDASKRLEELLVNCPGGSEDIYKIGLRLYRNQLDEATTDEAKKAVVDKIVKLYDLQAIHFDVDKNGKIVKYEIMGNKIREMMGNEFMWEKYQKEIFDGAKAVIKESGENLDLNFVLVYFKTLTDRFLSDKMHSDVVLEEFAMLSDAVAKNVAPNKSEIQRLLDGLLINSGAADCDNLENLFKPQYEKNPNDLVLIKKIMRYLSTNNCESVFKTQLAEKYYKLEPSADAAYNLATTFVAQKNSAKATQYFKEAIARETDREVRTKYEFRLAGMYLMNKNYLQAADFAKKAIASDPRNGLAYFVLANAYVMGANDVTCDSFDKKAIYWLAVSNFEKAMTLIDAGAPQIPEIKKMIAASKANFPTMEDLFYKESLKIGDPYNVNCGWIKGATKVYDPK